MSTAKAEWLTRFCDAAQIGLGIGFVLDGEFLGAAFILLGCMSFFYRRLRDRAYLDGWMRGRAQLLELQAQSETKEQFVESMIEVDLSVMRHQIGDRQTDKFLDHFVKHVARSDGSHDKL